MNQGIYQADEKQEKIVLNILFTFFFVLEKVQPIQKSYCDCPFIHQIIQSFILLNSNLSYLIFFQPSPNTASSKQKYSPAVLFSSQIFQAICKNYNSIYQSLILIICSLLFSIIQLPLELKKPNMDMILDDSFQPNDEIDIWNDQLFNTQKVCAVSKPTDISDSHKEQEYGILGFGDLGDDDIINQIGKQFVWDYELPNLSYKLESHVSQNEDEKIIHDSQNGKMEIENQSKVSKNRRQEGAIRQIEENEQILEKLSADFLKSKEIKKGWKKNTNLPKFLVRIYMKYYQEFSEDQSSSAISYFKRVKKEIKSKGSNAYKISDVLKFFENPKKANLELSRNNREVMARILRETCQEQIIESNYIQGNLRSYLMRSKVYALRCRSRNLVQRVKIN